MRTRRGRWSAAAALLMVLPWLACAGGTVPEEPGEPAATAAGAEILWDEWGIPHIRASDAESLFHAYGWAQAQNHAALILENVGVARGRAAELWGEEHVESDRWMHRVGLPAWTERGYEGLDPEMRRWIDAFAAGFTAWAEAHPDAVPETAARVLPLIGRDVLANAGAVALEFSDAASVGRRWRARRQRERAAEEGEAAAALVPPPGPSPGDELLPASNAWALGPGKTLGDETLLLANPHLPWRGNLTWMEAHLTAPGIDVYGASLVGMPVVNIGWNRRLGWTHTVNTQDTEDFYELVVVELGEDRLGYRWDGGVRPFEHAVVTLRVRQEDATFGEEELGLISSVHGPVIARVGPDALALRRVDEVAEGLGDAFRQWWEMARAGDLEEFTAALGRQAVVGQNVTYADADGHIAYFYGAATPRRARGDRAFWSAPVPGDDPELVWTELHPFEEIPRIVDPPSGWVQNANDPPWIATWPVTWDPASYPDYFAPRPIGLRPQRSLRMLLEGGDIDLEEMIRRKHSTRLEAADRLLPELLEAAGGSDDPRVARAAEVLAAWDRETDADSLGAVLFTLWFYSAGGEPGALYAEPWSAGEPLETPDGLADPRAAVEVLGDVAAEMEAGWGALDVPWGEALRLRRDELDLPGNGAPGGLGSFRVAYFPAPPTEPRPIVGGASFVAAIEFGEAAPRARAVIPYGNASAAGSPHRTDQLRLFAEKRLRPVYFTAEEVEAAAVEREEVGR